MTSRRRSDSFPRLRDDLGAVAVDGDIVVYDATAETAHVLSGGAVAVWLALENETGPRDVTARVAEIVGEDPRVIADEVDDAVRSFRERGFLVADSGA
ncbi:PqqD family protein [Ilumatobacter nonamiensis]|uniref:PqqD family protein n=1 Tax=Ilumatobacter nonamiensis TaxID=467093 RepID=UPI00034B6B20|nr:PqqD family protein [Ilumatobacter nonamiensis]